MTSSNLYRILCTHHVRFLSRADVVLILEEGRVKECGPPETVLPHLPHQSNTEDEEEPKSEEKEEERGRRNMEVREQAFGSSKVIANLQDAIVLY